MPEVRWCCKLSHGLGFKCDGIARIFSSDYTSLLLLQKSSTTVRVFDRTVRKMYYMGMKPWDHLCLPSSLHVQDYYTVHGEDALLAAKEVFHTNSVIKNLGTGKATPAPPPSVPPSSFFSLLVVPPPCSFFIPFSPSLSPLSLPLLSFSLLLPLLLPPYLSPLPPLPFLFPFLPTPSRGKQTTVCAIEQTEF